MRDVIIEQSWKDVLQNEFTKEYWTALTDFVRNQYTKTVVFPEPKNIFKAFSLTPFHAVKVVILGQDPYHGLGQANGLSFAVNSGVDLPPSLKNIFHEIEKDLGYKPVYDGDLSRWARQGVLLLNSVLTVEKGKPASHKAKGWERFTDAVIQKLALQRKQIVYILWGKYAQEKGAVIDKSNNLVLSSGHPSPYSSHLFFGNKHFSQTNTYLKNSNKTEIDWR